MAAQVPQGARLADIGSDHGYLPVALMLRGILDAAVAGEVAQTPFASAQRNVRRNGLEGRVSVRLADGLAAVEPGDRISVISICGMGGDTMCEILEAGKQRLAGVTRLVLQPNGAERELRQWLMGNGYRIVSEELLRENRFDYEIIVAEPGGAAVHRLNSCTSARCWCRRKARRFWSSGGACCGRSSRPWQTSSGPAVRCLRRKSTTSGNRSAGSPRYWPDSLLRAVAHFPVVRFRASGPGGRHTPCARYQPGSRRRCWAG
ncbi:hypothetical protein PPS11_21914 [Pseudomonas putida S11]|nr:hypothetical protein PPS11_21914 [Pseudomonas putida S11]